MTTALGAAISAGLTSLRSSLGTPTFTWKSREVPCVNSSVRRGTLIIYGGHEVAVSLTLFVDFNEFLTVDTTLHTVDDDLLTMDDDRPTPVAGKKLTFKGRVYRILSAREASGKSHCELELGDPNR